MFQRLIGQSEDALQLFRGRRLCLPTCIYFSILSLFLHLMIKKIWQATRMCVTSCIRKPEFPANPFFLLKDSFNIQGDFFFIFSTDVWDFAHEYIFKILGWRETGGGVEIKSHFRSSGYYQAFFFGSRNFKPRGVCVCACVRSLKPYTLSPSNSSAGNIQNSRWCDWLSPI